MDRFLSLKWNPKIQRWELLRSNPVKPQLPPERVRVWSRYKQGHRFGEYLPLDERLFDWLRESDMAIRFRHRDRKYWGAMMEKELEDMQAKMDAEKASQQQELRGELQKALAYNIERGERGKSLCTVSYLPRAAR